MLGYTKLNTEYVLCLNISGCRNCLYEIKEEYETMKRKANLNLEECLSILDLISGMVVIDKDGLIKYLSPDMEERIRRFGDVQEDTEFIGSNILSIHPMSKITKALKSEEKGEIVFYMAAGLPNIAKIKPIIKDGKVLGAIDYDLLLSSDWEEFLRNTGQASIGGGFSIKEDLMSLINKSLEKEKIKYNIDHIVGKGTKITELKQNVRKAADSDSQVLITGETGSGKEMIAWSIYNLSRRANGPIIEVNCAAIPENLIESELFGYDTGSFTGARAGGKKGFFEMADKGVLFLDEVDHLPYHAQPKLLRVLQEQEVNRIGGSKVSVDIRVITATNKELKKLVEEGAFREDLYYRLNVINIEAPPLREHKEDIPILVEEHLNKLNIISGHKKMIADEVYSLFDMYNWPGNVRELFNLVERGFAMSKTDVINVKDFGELFVELVRPNDDIKGKHLQAIRDDAEKEAIKQILEFCDGNKSRTAELLGITRGNLYYKLKRYDIR